MLDPSKEYQATEAVWIRFPASGGFNEYRRWNGYGPLLPGQIIGAPAELTAVSTPAFTAGDILDVGEIEIGDALVAATSIRISVTPDDPDASDPTSEEIQRFLTDGDPGPAACYVYELWRSRDHGRPWEAWILDGQYHGKLSTPEYQDGEIQIEIQRVFDDVWRGTPLRWTGTDQRRRLIPNPEYDANDPASQEFVPNADDSGLDRADRIRRSGLLVAST